MKILEQEISLVTGEFTSPTVGDNEETQLHKYFKQGLYEEILDSDFGRNILKENSASNDDLVSTVKYNIDTIWNSTDDKQQLEFDVLLVGAASLQLFIQNNWLGPVTSRPPTDFIPDQFIAKLHAKCLEELSIDGESVYLLTRYLPYLYISYIILNKCQHRFPSLETHKWWLLRCLYIQQEVLDDRSPSLCKIILELVDFVDQNTKILKDDQFREVSIQWNIEAGYFCHLYFEYKKGREFFEKAKNLSHLEINISGALGKRTRYQEDDKAQLVLQVKRLNVKDDEGLKKDIPLPKNISLEDDTVLNNIAFTDKSKKHSVQLSPLDQAVVLACMEGHRRSLASERLTDEEVLTYISCILDQLCNWNVGVACLILRSKLEKGSSRRVERSMRQMEELVNTLTQPQPANVDRSHLFHACHTPSVCKLKKELGTLLLSLGCISAAKDLYESLEMWDEAITCYQIMNKTDQAEVIIREQLKKKETPNLYCFLGDVTRDINHYQKAWALSNEKSSRAMRCMGYLYFGKEDYLAALRCFEKSLEINSLQIPVWFTYGCVALTTEKYEKAVKAFKRCVNIDSDNFEAWNNMGTAYIRLKDKPKAFLTMKEAIKYNYESWQLWENCLVIGIDCGEFEDVVNAYNRLMDLKSKWMDEQILSILVRAIEEDVTDSKGLPARRLKPKIEQLFTRITSQTTGNGEIWRLFAKLILLDNKPENIDQGLEYLQKSHRCVTQTSNWEKEEKKCEEVSNQAIQLAQLYVECADQLADKTKKLQNLSSAKFMIKGVVTKIKQHHLDPITQTIPQSIDELCKSLDNQLQDLLTRIDQLKNS